MKIPGSVFRIAALAAFFFVLAALWRWTGLRTYADADTLARLASTFRHNPSSPAIILLVYVASGFVVFPITVLIVATALVFDPVKTIGYALTGCFLNAAAFYGVGRLLGRNLVQRLEDGKFESVAKILSHQGILTMALIRNIPVAPYAAVNVAAGALRFNFRDYSIGTLVGMAPGVVLVSLLTEQLKRLVEQPNIWSGIVSIALFCIIIVASWGVKAMARKSPEYKSDSDK